VASTGLLTGINPYKQQRAVIDISSKPLNFALQLQQKEQAKSEALDKYLMDYEKSIDPSGMRSIDKDVFLSKLQEQKAFYLKNRDCILNPAKCGAEAQSKYMAGFKDLQSLIGQSKSQAADDKVVNEKIYNAIQKKQTIHDAVLPEIQASQQYSIRDPRFKKFDPIHLRFDDPFSEDEFIKTTFGKITPSETLIGSRSLPDGAKVYKFEKKVSPDDINTIVNRAAIAYETQPEVAKQVNQLIQNGSINSFQKYFEKAFPKQDFNTATPKQLAGAIAIGLGDIGGTREGAPVQAPRTNINIGGYGRVPQGNLLDQIGGYGKPVEIENKDTKGNAYRIDNGKIVNKDNNPAQISKARISGRKMPEELFSILAKIGIKIYADDIFNIASDKNGDIISIQSPDGGIITRQTIRNAQLAAYNEPKWGEQAGFDMTIPEPPASTKVISKNDFKNMSLSDRQKFLNSGGQVK
jgi:hypothetical protein